MLKKGWSKELERSGLSVRLIRLYLWLNELKNNGELDCGRKEHYLYYNFQCRVRDIIGIDLSLLRVGDQLPCRCKEILNAEKYSLLVETNKDSELLFQGLKLAFGRSAIPNHIADQPFNYDYEGQCHHLKKHVVDIIDYHLQRIEKAKRGVIVIDNHVEASVLERQLRTKGIGYKTFYRNGTCWEIHFDKTTEN